MQRNATQQTQHSESQQNANARDHNNTTDHNATQDNRHNTFCNAMQHNTTQHNSPQNTKTGNKNHPHVPSKPVEVTSSTTKNSMEKTFKKRCSYNGRSCGGQPRGWQETQESYANQTVVTKCHLPLRHS